RLTTDRRERSNPCVCTPRPATPADRPLLSPEERRPIRSNSPNLLDNPPSDRTKDQRRENPDSGTWRTRRPTGPPDPPRSPHLARAEAAQRVVGLGRFEP